MTNVPDTLNFAIFGYLTIFGLLGAYIGWLFQVSRRLTKKLRNQKKQ